MDKMYEKYHWLPGVPKKWKNIAVTFDETHKWYPVKGTESFESWVTVPCTECNRVFHGSQNGAIELALHKILKHVKVISVG